MTLTAKVPIEVTVCSSCGRNVSTDGETIRCEAGHEKAIEDISAPKARRWFRRFTEWAGSAVPKEGSSNE